MALPAPGRPGTPLDARVAALVAESLAPVPRASHVAAVDVDDLALIAGYIADVAASVQAGRGDNRAIPGDTAALQCQRPVASRAMIGGVPIAVRAERGTTSCYGDYEPCRPLCVLSRPGHASDLDITCITSVYGRGGPGTAPARRHANRPTTGHDWTLSTVSTTRTEARKAPRKTRTAPRRTPYPTDNCISICPRLASLVWPPGSASSRTTTQQEGFSARLARRSFPWAQR